MKRMTWVRPLIGTAVMATLGLAAQAPAFAGPEEDLLGLKMASAISKDRFFVRAGAIYIKVRTKSSDTYDVTGPILYRDELQKVTFKTDVNGQIERDADGKAVRIQYSGLIPPQSRLSGSQVVSSRDGVPTDISGVDRSKQWLVGTEVVRTRAMNALRSDLTGVFQLTEVMLPADLALPAVAGSPALTPQGITALGTPPGITAEAAKEMGTLGLSLGYYFSDDHTWVTEAYVLAAPLSTSATTRGIAVNTAPLGDDPGDDRGLRTRPISINGQKVVTSKLIPPTVLFGRYFGGRDSMIRPYLGISATYAIFYDSKASQTLNEYVGGSNPGDTTVSLKNAFGMGPVVGLQVQNASGWHASLNVGYTRLKTTASIVTRNTFLTSKTGAVYDLGPVSQVIQSSSAALDTDNNNIAAQGGTVAAVSRILAGTRNGATCGDGGSCLGTYERRQDLTLDNTLFMLSVGRSF